MASGSQIWPVGRLSAGNSLAGQEATALASRALPRVGQSVARYFGSHYINPNPAPSCSRGSAGLHVPQQPAGPVAAGTGTWESEQGRGQGRRRFKPTQFNPCAAACLLSDAGSAHLSVSQSSPPHPGPGPAPGSTDLTPNTLMGPRALPGASGPDVTPADTQGPTQPWAGPGNLHFKPSSG